MRYPVQESAKSVIGHLHCACTPSRAPTGFLILIQGPLGGLCQQDAKSRTSWTDGPDYETGIGTEYRTITRQDSERAA